jgi:rhodanese-related sulfurtransferase
MVKKITKEEIMEKIDRGEKFRLIDVRNTPDYNKEHIVGAVHLLISEMTPDRLEALLEKDDVIITYSEDINCPAKTIAAQKLMELRCRNVFAYEGSWKEWKESGYPVEQTANIFR